MTDKNRAAESSADMLPQVAPQAPRPSFPTVGDFFAMLGIALGMQLVAGLAMALVGLVCGISVDALDPAQRGVWFAIAYVASMLPACLLVLAYRRFRGGMGPVGHFALKGWNPVLLLWAFVFMMAVGVVCEPLFALLPKPVSPDLGRGVWTVLAVVVAAPVLEEWLCRPPNCCGVAPAWFFSSLFFGVLHGEPLLVANAFVIGLILGYVYVATGSLWASMILHAMNNVVAYLLMVAGLSDTLMIELAGSRTLYVIIYISALLVTAVSAWMMWRTLRGLGSGAKKEPEVQ